VKPKSSESEQIRIRNTGILLFSVSFLRFPVAGQLFAKFDYCGIAFLTVGSFVPWLYYSFYCSFTPKASSSPPPSHSL
jgi:hypothetical protein